MEIDKIETRLRIEQRRKDENTTEREERKRTKNR